MDILEAHYFDEKNHNRMARFIFLKNRSASAAQIEAALHPQPMTKVSHETLRFAFLTDLPVHF